jgi:tetratricopeptide (TPR) repeat protein
MKFFKFIFILTLSIVPFFHLHGQRLHDPDEIMRIIKASKIDYQFDSLEKVEYRAIYPKKGQEGILRIDNGNDIRLEIIAENNYSKSIFKKLKKGDNLLKKSKPEKARNCYQLALEEKNSDTKIINKIAHTYLLEKDYGTAIFWYERSIIINYVDTEARRNIAKCHVLLGDMNNALQQISYAHLFNRNNKEIAKELKNIYAKAKINYNLNYFSPKYQIIKVNNSKILITSAHSIWAAYAAVEALWKHEPGYEKKMITISNQSIAMIRKKEALLNALITYENTTSNNKKKSFPLLELLRTISLQGQIDNFLLYEIIAQEYPNYILQLPKEKIEELKNYMIEYRSGI